MAGHASTVVFRADASLQIGTGHVMRCLTLADALREEGASVLFVCRDMPGSLVESIRFRGHAVRILPRPVPVASAPDATSPVHAAWLGTDWATDVRETLDAVPQAVDWLVVDHYALDHRWEGAARNRCRRLMVIDDLRDRPHDCDVLLDQNLGVRASDYAGLAPPACRLLAGPSFALLRPAFAALREQSLQRRQHARIQQLLLCMGGVDKDNFTGAVLDALPSCELSEDVRVVVVMGSTAPWLSEVRQMASRLPWSTEVLVGVSDMARLMADSDAAIGAAGTMAWERCSLGLPSLMYVLADNQQAGASALAGAGAALLLPDPWADALALRQALATLRQAPSLHALQLACSNVTDGRGVERVIGELNALDPVHA